MINIIDMNILDYDEIFSLWKKSENISLRESDSKENINAYLERNQGLSFVAKHDDKTIGAVLTGTDGRRGYLQHLCVDKDYRGRGIGKSLLSKSIDALSKIGIYKTHLSVFTHNFEAQNFYKKLGWGIRDELALYSYNNSKYKNI